MSAGEIERALDRADPGWREALSGDFMHLCRLYAIEMERELEHRHRVAIVPALHLEDVIRWARKVSAAHVGRDVAELDCAARRLGMESRAAIRDALARDREDH